MQKIKKNGGYIVTDRLEVHKVERSANAWGDFIQDKIYAENIIAFLTKNIFFIYLLSSHCYNVAFIATCMVISNL
jgi:hypothetical protein